MDREKSSGQTHLFNILKERNLRSTSGQAVPTVQGSMSLKILPLESSKEYYSHAMTPFSPSAKKDRLFPSLFLFLFW
jgi:hypothetical protein